MIEAARPPTIVAVSPLTAAAANPNFFIFTSSSVFFCLDL
jgi:hypothetical protein